MQQLADIMEGNKIHSRLIFFGGRRPVLRDSHEPFYFRLTLLSSGEFSLLTERERVPL
jgi:hypothetical protein